MPHGILSYFGGSVVYFQPACLIIVVFLLVKSQASLSIFVIDWMQ